jgi:hypothetical protein
VKRNESNGTKTQKQRTMKKIFTLSIITLLTAVVFSGCVKRYGDINNDNYWLSQERGEVVYSDPYCSFYVVETPYGYNILRAVGGYRPYEGATVYGNFSTYGTRDFYNRSSGTVFTAEVYEYWLSYYDAQDAINYYCPYSKAMPAKENPVQNKSKTPDTK